MFIEEIFKRFLNVEHESYVFFLGIFVTMIGVIVGHLLFEGDIMPGIFFTTMPLVVFTSRMFYRKIKNREIAKIYALLFLGMAIVFGIAYIFLSDTIDVSIYNNIDEQDPFLLFSSILSNNVRLLFILFLLSMLYNIGSLFILAFNAALVGQLFSSFAVYGRFDLFVFFLPHTAIELVSFFLAAIAGAILSIAFTAHKKRDAEFDERILRSSIFFMFAVMTVITGALLESFLLPYLVAVFV